MSKVRTNVRTVIAKTHTQRDRFLNELSFYHNPKYAKFRPELIGYDQRTMTLFIEKMTPLDKVVQGFASVYGDNLWKLLEELHEAGANHRDVHLVNIVVDDDFNVKLIDWEVATERIGEKSIDLYGAVAAGVKNELPEYGENGIWWGDGREGSPGEIWGNRDT